MAMIPVRRCPSRPTPRGAAEAFRASACLAGHPAPPDADRRAAPVFRAMAPCAVGTPANGAINGLGVSRRSRMRPRRRACAFGRGPGVWAWAAGPGRRWHRTGRPAARLAVACFAPRPCMPRFASPWAGPRARRARRAQREEGPVAPTTGGSTPAQRSPRPATRGPADPGCRIGPLSHLVPSWRFARNGARNTARSPKAAFVSRPRCALRGCGHLPLAS
jgi:hypothetical protein